ncbi:MAG: carboxyl transferase domain-containing protein [Alphaproteobacteria bacterium]
MPRSYLDFEEPLRELDRLREAAALSGDEHLAERLDREIASRAAEIAGSLTAWQRLQVARHPDRPSAIEAARVLCTDFVELHGDRCFGDDPAVVAGLARRSGRPVAVVGHCRGRDPGDRVRRNFGMARPEGFRKARRVFELAGRMGLPILTIVDTQGAWPGAESEERGIAESIAGCLAALASVPVPVVAAILGEGGSGGALAFAVADRLVALENGCLSVITPEGCASILDRKRTPEGVSRAAESLHMGARDLLRLGVADVVVAEPPGGAHRDPDAAVQALGREVDRAFAELVGLAPDVLRARRDERLRRLGRAELDVLVESDRVC